jgi:two-component system NarL family sensor kinase
MDTQQTKIFVAVVVASAIILTIVVYFVITILKSQRIHLQMQQRSMLMEISALEKERKRIVSDLHDELGALLSVVKFQVSSLATNNQHDLMLVHRATSNLDSILERIRAICHEMMPQVLIRKGFQMAVREFIHQLDAADNVQLECTLDDSIEFDEQNATHMYRIVQEVVNNTLKHAKAKIVRIDLTYNNSKVVLSITDDGVGFDTRTIYSESAGFGLNNIISRIKILNADLYLTSEPGKGTSYYIELPLT